MTHLHVQFEPAAPLVVLHSELRSHVHEFGTMVSPELSTVPPHVPLHALEPALQYERDLSLQSRLSMGTTTESSRQSEGSVHTTCDPDAGPVMGVMEMDSHASFGGGGGGGGGQPTHRPNANVKTRMLVITLVVLIAAS